MVIFLVVLPFLDPRCSVAVTIFLPSLTLPETTYKRAIQSFSFGSADGKLGTICVGSSICQGQDARTHMLQDEILIKFLPLDGFAARAIMVYEVTLPPSL